MPARCKFKRGYGRDVAGIVSSCFADYYNPGRNVPDQRFCRRFQGRAQRSCPDHFPSIPSPARRGLLEHCRVAPETISGVSDESGLPLPPVRCLTKEQAAAYLGIGVTLLLQIGLPPIEVRGARCGM